MRFSQRVGATRLPSLLGREDMPESLRNRLWSVVHEGLADHVGAGRTGEHSSRKYIISLWDRHWKLPVDTLPWREDLFLTRVRKAFFGFKWYQVLDLVEFIAQNDPGTWRRRGDDVTHQFNTVLVEELAAWRLISGRLEPVTDEHDIAVIAEASNTPVREVRTHVHKALELLGRRPTPDPANAIKEAISACESISRIITGLQGKEAFGAALTKLEADGFHPQFVKAWKELFWYTSDDGGIRHGLKPNQDAPELDQAKLFVTMASAFVNYMTIVYVAKLPRRS